MAKPTDVEQALEDQGTEALKALSSSETKAKMLRVAGRLAYEGYKEASAGLSLISGAELPPWEVLSADIQDAWCAAASKVLNV